MCGVCRLGVGGRRFAGGSLRVHAGARVDVCGGTGVGSKYRSAFAPAFSLCLEPYFTAQFQCAQASTTGRPRAAWMASHAASARTMGAWAVDRRCLGRKRTCLCRVVISVVIYNFFDRFCRLVLRRWVSGLCWCTAADSLGLRAASVVLAMTAVATTTAAMILETEESMIGLWEKPMEEI